MNGVKAFVAQLINHDLIENSSLHRKRLETTKRQLMRSIEVLQ